MRLWGSAAMSTANVVTDQVPRPLALLTEATSPAPRAVPARPVPMPRAGLVVVDAAAALTASLAVASSLGHYLLPFLWVVVIASVRGYESRLGRPLNEELRRVVHAGLGLVLAGAAVSWFVAIPSAPGELLGLVALTTGLSLAARAGLSGVRAWRLARGRGVAHPVVLVGHHQQVADAIRDLRRTRSHGFEVVGACTHGRDRAESLPVPSVPGIDDIPGAVEAFGAQAVIVLPCKHVDAAALRRLGWQLEASDTQLFVVPGLAEVTGTRTTLTTVASIPMVHVRRAELSGWRRAVKDVGERAIALIALLLASPLLLGLILAIRIDSPGSALFRQVRVGRDNRPFTMLKLRTMTEAADTRRTELAAANQADGVLFKIRDDPRVTRLGRFLRRYSLDELPQLLNVVRGDMALVGPRPPLPTEVERYPDDVRRRLVVKPGLTGLWQVSGRSDLAWEESVRLDLRYVDNWSLGLDAAIMLRTVRAVVSHQGAY